MALEMTREAEDDARGKACFIATLRERVALVVAAVPAWLKGGPGSAGHRLPSGPMGCVACVLATVLLLAGTVTCVSAADARAAHGGGVVSLDYCADQFVIKLLPRARIAAVSPDADAPFSYMREEADGLPRVRPLAEDVLILRPAMVVRSYGGGPNATIFFRRAGIAVLQIGFPSNVEEVRRTILDVASGLGVPARGEAVVHDMDQRLARIRTRTAGSAALYMTPSGVTSGPGTLVHAIFQAVGLENFQRAAGWRSLPLERLAYDRPDLIASALFGSSKQLHAWSAGRHPVLRRQLRDTQVAMLDGAWTSCGGWFLVDAVEALARALDE